MSLILNITLLLLLLGFIFFIFLALLAPFESLGWWAGWTRRTVERELTGERDDTKPVLPRGSDASKLPVESDVRHYLVYLRGIATAEADPSRREQGFLDYLSEHLPAACIISDVFPYSATNNPLIGERLFTRLYQWLNNARTRYRMSLFAILFIMRNLLQVAVSGDRRYGPIFNAGIAREIGYSLVQKCYPLGSGEPIWVMGWSGAGQIAVGAARYLHQLFHAPVYVVSIGGVMLDDPGIAEIEHLFHLQGSKDHFPLLGDVLSPGRWPFVRHSPWNRAREEGRITVVDPGPMKHTGNGDYFDHKALLPDGKSHAERTADVIAEIITKTVYTQA